MRKLKNILTYSNVVATLGVFLALGGSALAVSAASKNSVTSRSIRDGAVQSQDVKDGALTGADIDQGSLSVRPSGPAGGDLRGTYPAPEIDNNSIGANEIRDDSLGTDEVVESTLGEVPVAALGGTGRYGFSGSCDPETPNFEPCSTVDVTVANPSRMLIIGTAGAQLQRNDQNFGVGYCRVGTTTGGAINASIDLVRVDESQQYENLTVMGVTDVLSPGTHTVEIECDEASPFHKIGFTQARVAAVALSGD
jgi:hypothetical protein